MSENSIKEIMKLKARVPFGPVDLVMFNPVVLTKDGLSFEHKHDYFEVHLAIKGNSTFVVDNEQHVCRQGQVCWINPQTYRFVHAQDDQELEHFVIHFDFLPRTSNTPYNPPNDIDIMKFLSQIYNKKVWICNDNNCNMELYNMVCRELRSKEFAYLIKIQNLLCSYIISTIQSINVCHISMQADPYMENSVMAHSVLSYIRHHYSEGITIEEAAKALNISPRHLTRVFRETYGTTFKAALQEYQIAKVKERLLSDDNLEQIAADTGFSSAVSMSGTFKKLTGKTVNQYRKQASSHDTAE